MALTVGIHMLYAVSNKLGAGSLSFPETSIKKKRKKKKFLNLTSPAFLSVFNSHIAPVLSGVSAQHRRCLGGVRPA